MIKHLRIDNRLIHGQVAVAWQKYINAKVIIVCNDAVAKDPIQKLALPLAARESKVFVYSIEETIRYAKEHADEQVFVIAKLPQDALAILDAGEKVAEINVGNAAPIVGTKYVMVTRSIAATKEDAEIYRKIAERNGGKLTSQIMPSMEPSNFLDALKKAGL